MYYFYVLYSLKDNRLYKGSTSDVGKRFLRHSAGGNVSTAKRRPLVMILVEEYLNKDEALKRERWSKSPEGGLALKQILKDKGMLTDEYRLNMQ